VSAPESPSAFLRAAALLRERAEPATRGPWRAREEHGNWYVMSDPDGQVTTGINEEPSLPEFLMIERDRQDAEYIATVHPLAGVALAGLLERFDRCACDEDGDHWPEKAAALALSRLLLGEPGTEGAER
jgi:hypothetical protein